MDEEAIDRERVLATIEITGESVAVRVAQRLDFDLLAYPIAVRVHPPRITFGRSFEMTGAQAIAAGHELLRAGAFIEDLVKTGEDGYSVACIESDAAARPLFLVED